MKALMRIKMLGVLLSTVLAAILYGEEAAKATYELHEWGVFGAPRNAKWSNLDMRAEWASFPKFFFRV